MTEGKRDVDLTTNEKIAEMLQAQTYEERMDMAAWLAGTASDAASDQTDMDADWFAAALRYWAANELNQDV